MQYFALLGGGALRNNHARSMSVGSKHGATQRGATVGAEHHACMWSMWRQKGDGGRAAQATQGIEHREAFVHR
jgi:hypothetical protein